MKNHPMSKLSVSTDSRNSAIAQAKRGSDRCLVVHDDLELRSRLAALFLDDLGAVSAYMRTPVNGASHMGVFNQ